MSLYLKRVARFAALVFVATGSAACALVLGVDDRVLDDVDGGLASRDDASAEDHDADATVAVVSKADAAADAFTVDADAAATALYCRELPVSTCAACAAGTAVCRGSCITDCAGECDPTTLGCFTCAGGPATGKCEAASTDASCIANPSYVHCPCATTADTCPGPNQVCVANECRTCGEPQTENQTCRDGTGMKKCRPATDPDPTKRLRCR